MSNLLRDNTFTDGFEISHTNALISREPVRIWKTIPNGVKPVWRISQWCSKFTLAEGQTFSGFDGSFTLANKAKRVKVYPHKGRIHLSVLASEEYEFPRKEGEGWPHLLIEQFFEDNRLINFNHLNAHIDLEWTQLIDYMDVRENHHTTQFQWIFAIGDLNKESRGYEDFFWFSMALIDAPRYTYPQPYMAEDGGKEETTHKFIYIPDSQLFLKKQPRVGEHIKVDYDLYQLILEGYQEAKQRGFLKNSDWKDMGLMSTNIGFEVTGTFDVGAIIHSILLQSDK